MRPPIGSQPWPPEGFAKVTGRTRFAADFAPPGTLSAHVLRSPHAHARIRSLDAAEALATRGVGAVLTAADVATRGTFGHAVRDRPLLAGRGRSAPGVNGGRLDGDPLFGEVAMGAAEIDLDAGTGALAIRS